MRALVEFGDRTVDWSSCPVPADVTSLDQVHGATTVVVTRPGQFCGAAADAAVTDVVGARLLIRTADCAPVALVAKSVGNVVAVGAVHLGWKGLRDGLLSSAVEAIRALGADRVDPVDRVEALLGPCIGPKCYEFGEADLDDVVRAVGPEVRAVTADGRPALDLLEGIATRCRSLGIEFDMSAWHCTACHKHRSFSYRARRDRGRQGLLVSMHGDPS